ncbi:hypothetical protein [Dyella sp. C9]|uniref:hypothetical protein n=1 Tax=Dyella sp. C9 TaxID=2202154 RepID=UPI000DEEE6A0|nr:hypothetical protein [Dyella sp. C9]
MAATALTGHTRALPAKSARMNDRSAAGNTAPFTPGAFALRAFWLELAAAALAVPAIQAIPTQGYQDIGLAILAFDLAALLVLCSFCFAIAACATWIRYRNDRHVQLIRAQWAAGLHGSVVFVGVVAWCWAYDFL